MAGLARQAAVFSGGTQVVVAGGVASGTSVKSGGTLLVQSGGNATGAVVSSGGLEMILGRRRGHRGGQQWRRASSGWAAVK